ncbi:MAG: helix-turn-helix domain-containing protein [Christensenellales bacterium]
MLKTTPDTITEIAGRCGYSDPNYFSVVFSRKFGVSPREYRKNKK